MPWSVVVPVKTLGAAKSRLLPDDDPSRPELALAFVDDALTALSHAQAVAQVLVVSDDARVQRLATERGAHWRPESPAHGLNAAAAHGLAELTGPVVVMAGDLPCLDGSAVDLVLRLAEPHEHSFVSDAQGTGTTMLLAHHANRCVPMFGERSRARHRAAGAIDLGLDVSAADRSILARARRDVDTAVDLADALRIGVGPATLRVAHWRAAP